MRLSNESIKSVLNYIIDTQTFDFDDGKMSTLYITTIVNELSDDNEYKMQEIACAIVRCINEGFILSNYPRNVWATAKVFDVTLRGFEWLENN